MHFHVFFSLYHIFIIITCICTGIWKFDWTDFQCTCTCCVQTTQVHSVNRKCSIDGDGSVRTHFQWRVKPAMISAKYANDFTYVRPIFMSLFRPKGAPQIYSEIFVKLPSLSKNHIAHSAVQNICSFVDQSQYFYHIACAPEVISLSIHIYVFFFYRSHHLSHTIEVPSFTRFLFFVLFC